MLTVGSMASVAYVRDIDASRAFYELLGFSVHSAGRAEASAWTALRNNEFLVLLASTTPPLDLPQLPLLFYFFYDDLEAVVGILEAAGVQVTRTGHPPHALGGEVKVMDPDGHILLLGQRNRSASQAPEADDDVSLRFSLLRESAAVVSARGGAAQSCRVRDRHGDPCAGQAEVKLADSRGDATWVCLAHAEEILVTVPTAFIASQDDEGINSFLLSHRLPEDQPRPGCSGPGWLPGVWRRAVAADDLPVGAGHLAGPVGVDDELPSHLLACFCSVSLVTALACGPSVWPS